MPGRSVLQWDKDDCAAIGLVKFDLLGLGMLSAIHYAIDFLAQHRDIHVDLAKIDLTEQAVYDMLCRADTVGVFQVESRAQMATLPRLKPRKFYDLVVEVALIRPGPIQGGSVHPYIRRRNKLEAPTCEHPSMEAALERTLGVPLFQEQLMQLATDVAGFSAAEADQLRRAMGSKRSPEKMDRLRGRFYQGMKDLHGITGEMADRIFEKMAAFANFGFPESHSQSFASLVFYSSWLKLHHPAAFCAALLKAQPMGFYSPQSLVADARRHGVAVHKPDINVSQPYADLENNGLDVRLGLGAVRNIGIDLAEQIVAQREAGGPFKGAADLSRRCEVSTRQLESLATAGALECFGTSRRQALWDAGAAAQEKSDRLALHEVNGSPALPGMSDVEMAASDVWATGVSPGSYPTEFIRPQLKELGVVAAVDLLSVPDGSRVLVGGAVTHRQRPATASGVTFVNLEDETGMVNVVCSVGLWAKYRKLAQSSPALLIRGRVQNAEGAVTVVAERMQRMDLRVATRSRDWA
jgi:error-prone DNA polymerase